MLKSIVATKDFAETLSYWATTGGILVAIAAGLGAYWKHRHDLRSHEWDRAREAYARFMELTIASPEFYPGFWSARDTTDPVTTNKYRWFMAHFLWACEDILLSHREKDEWWDSLKITVVDHRDYFESEEGRHEVKGYFLPVRDLVGEVLGESPPVPTLRHLEVPAPPVTT